MFDIQVKCDLLTNDLGLCRALIQLLSQGRPVSAGALARASGRPREEVLAVIGASSNVELDAQGRIVGAGLSLRPTAHRLLLGDRSLYAWCALDALMYLPLLGLAAQVESLCAATGSAIRMQVSTGGMRDVTPTTAVVSVVRPDGILDVRQGFCNHVHFFRSSDAAQPWVAQRRSAPMLSIEEASLLGKQLVTVRAGTAD